MRWLQYAIIVCASVRTYGALYTVRQDGSGDYTEINAAVDTAVDGDTVLVGAGRYSAHFAIDKAIAVIGNGMDSSFILADSNRQNLYYDEAVGIYPFSLEPDYCGLLSGFTIQGYGRNGCGIFCEPYDRTTISNIRILGFEWGIRVGDSPAMDPDFGMSSADAYLKIYNTSITGNRIGILLDGMAIAGGGGFSDSVIYNATYNWWGTNNPDSIAAYISDGGGRRVDYTEWLPDSTDSLYEDCEHGFHFNNINDNSDWNVMVRGDFGCSNLPLSVNECYSGKLKFYSLDGSPVLSGRSASGIHLIFDGINIRKAITIGR